VAGVVGALGYLTGLVDGPLLGVVGGLALVALGRGLLAAEGAELIAPASFAVVAGAAGVVSLRWGTLELDSIGGIQAVLGPTMVVEPTLVAGGAIAAFVAALIAAGIGMTEPVSDEVLPRWWWWVESATIAGVLGFLFVGSPLTDFPGAGLWAGGSAAAAGAIYLSARFAASRSMAQRVVVIGLCAAVVAVAAGLATGAGS
jgi:hypothetical protein